MYAFNNSNMNKLPAAALALATALSACQIAKEGPQGPAPVVSQAQDNVLAQLVDLQTRCAAGEVYGTETIRNPQTTVQSGDQTWTCEVDEVFNCVNVGHGKPGEFRTVNAAGGTIFTGPLAARSVGLEDVSKTHCELESQKNPAI